MSNKKNQNEQVKFQEKIISIFTNTGFTHFKTDKKPFNFDKDNSIEIDHVFVYENILIVCEDTILSYKLSVEKNKEEKRKLKDKLNKHKSNKKAAAYTVLSRKREFLYLLKNRFKNLDPDGKYGSNDYRFYFLYFDYMSEEATEQEKQEYEPLILVSQTTVEYFLTISSSIKRSFRYELFRFLGMKRQDYLPSEISGTNQKLLSPIIYPERWTGYEEVRVVTFMMQPKVLLEIACVLRKDSWDGKNDLYQRLITNKRISEVRTYLAKENTMFLNNIIVTMPDNISFFDKDKRQVSIDSISTTNEQYSVDIPLEYNSMAIIDGQHRVYGFYEDIKYDEIEKQISIQRNKHSLLVTGIIYPKTQEWTEERKRQFESKLFLSINRNSKQVDADTLILVQSILDPTSREGLSRKVIEEMNKAKPFEKMFKLTKMSTAPISISSIIQYALVFLVDTNQKKDKKNEPLKTLYHYWLEKEGKPNNYELQLEDREKYIKYCSHCISEFFKAVNSHFLTEWDNPKSKILKVIGINSLIMAYREVLPLTKGPQDSKYYELLMKGWDFHFVDTDTEKFNYSGSNYKKLANEKIIPWLSEQINKQP